MKSAQSSPDKSSEEEKNPDIPTVTIETTDQPDATTTKKVISASLWRFLLVLQRRKTHKKRGISPITLSSELRIKVADQQVRLDSIMTFKIQLAENEAQLDLSEIDIWSKNLEKNHQRFTSEHNYVQGFSLLSYSIMSILLQTYW